ncbi:alpha/beta hydrolase [Aliikangiella maris]|uniref:Alpha/beta hydrolase n=2 Tax=Aliikangiella maris TaxID=3162458 RepID=A0ABV3MKS1_9GAMM
MNQTNTPNKHAHSNKKNRTQIFSITTVFVLSLSTTNVFASPASTKLTSSAEQKTIKHYDIPSIDLDIPEINWQPCETRPAPFECAQVDVPLSYSPYDRSDKTTSIALARYPASDPEQKIGSILLNPGGPGGSGVNFVLNAGPFLFSPQVREKFDLIGFDPRGIGASNPLQCFTSAEEQEKALASPAEPTEFEAILEKRKADKFFAKLCRKNGGDIFKHMSTADVARDMDLLRQALGEEKLNFVGYSYGSYLGTTYANMFPDNFRTIVVDGVLDPIAWSTGRYNERFYLPVTTRLKSDVGSMDTLNEFFRLCDENPQTCFFSGNSAARFDAIIQKLKVEPLEIELSSGELFVLTHIDFLGITTSTLYSTISWPFYSALLADIESRQAPKQIATQLENLVRKLGIEDRIFSDKLPQSAEGFVGVLCSDSSNPRDYFAWPFAAEYSNMQNGYFGSGWTWASSPCRFWKPAKNRYVGPFNKITDQPILVASTLFDPATPYHGAQIVAGLMPKAKLLTVESWGHTTPFLSSCGDEVTANYLLTGELPAAKNTICPTNFTPFETLTDQRQQLQKDQQSNREKLVKALLKSNR